MCQSVTLRANLELFVEAVALEQHSARGELKQNVAQTPHVERVGHVWKTNNDFRRPVPQRAQLLRFALDELCHATRRAEIGHFEHFAVLVDKQIVELQKQNSDVSQSRYKCCKTHITLSTHESVSVRERERLMTPQSAYLRSVWTRPHCFMWYSAINTRLQ